MSEAITLQESARLVELEDVIERGLKNFIAVGEALMEIRNKRLYRSPKYSTFEDYCREEWNMTRMYASNLIRSSEAAQNVNNCLQTPANEAQARPLTKLENPEQQREAWTAAVEASDGKPTAKHVEAAVEVIKDREEKTPEQKQSPKRITFNKPTPEPTKHENDSEEYQQAQQAIERLSIAEQHRLFQWFSKLIRG